MADWPRFDDDRNRLNEQGQEFLNTHTRKGTLITNGRDGYPHAIPLTYFRVGDDLYMAGRRRSQRLANISRDPRVSFLVEDGWDFTNFQGLLVQGDAALIDDDAEKLRIARAAAAERGEPEADWPADPPRGVLIRIQPRKYTSWDNTRAPREG